MRSLIGLTATPGKQTFGFFNQNLVMEYGHEQAVADGVNVNYDVYRIRTQVSEAGGKVESGYYVDLRDKLTRKVRWEQLDEEFDYDPEQLDRDVVARGPDPDPACAPSGTSCRPRSSPAAPRCPRR